MFCYQITRTDMVVLYWNWHLSAFLELLKWARCAHVSLCGTLWIAQMQFYHYQYHFCHPASSTICKQSAPRSSQITTPTPYCSILQAECSFWLVSQQCQNTEGYMLMLPSFKMFVAEWHSVGNCKASGSGETEATTSKEKSKFSWTDDANNNTWYSRSEIPE